MRIERFQDPRGRGFKPVSFSVKESAWRVCACVWSWQWSTNTTRRPKQMFSPHTHKHAKTNALHTPPPFAPLKKKKKSLNAAEKTHSVNFASVDTQNLSELTKLTLGNFSG